MRKPRTTVAVLAVAVAATIGGVALATGGGSSLYGSPAGKSPSGRTAPITVANQATVTAVTATVQGTPERILVDARGLPLYTYKLDTASTSNVTGRLAALWPPLVADTPTARGANGALTALQTTNGKQVNYNGHFLYTFVDDSPGKVTGQGVQNFFVATPGSAANTTADTTIAPPPSNNVYTYGH
jgi:predicted lipoprotein with Yx(FWY)xxD motif